MPKTDMGGGLVFSRVEAADCVFVMFTLFGYVKCQFPVTHWLGFPQTQISRTPRDIPASFPE